MRLLQLFSNIQIDLVDIKGAMVVIEANPKNKQGLAGLRILTIMSLDGEQGVPRCRPVSFSRSANYYQIDSKH